MSKKTIWQLIGTTLGLLGDIGAIISLVAGVTPEKKNEIVDKKEKTDNEDK